VGVHSEDSAHVDRGEQVLRKLDPLSIDRFDKIGRRRRRD